MFHIAGKETLNPKEFCFNYLNCYPGDWLNVRQNQALFSGNGMVLSHHTSFGPGLRQFKMADVHLTGELLFY